MYSKLCTFILGLGFLATGYAQSSYTATLMNYNGPFDNAGLIWISDDGRTGFGNGVTSSPFTLQCFTYQDGTVTIIPMPGYYCQPKAAAAGVYVLKLNSGGDWIHDTLVSYINGKFHLITPPDGVNLSNSTLVVNKNGQMGGTFFCTDPSGTTMCAYTVSSDGTFTRLPDLGGYSGGSAINDAGDVAGWVCPPGEYYPECPSQRAVIWPHTGGMKDLSGLTSMKLGWPVGINSRGQVAGASPYVSGGSGFFYDGAGTVTPIQPSGVSSGDAVPLSVATKSLNDQGEVVGTYRTPQGSGLLYVFDYPFYYANGVAKDMNSSLANLPTNLYLSSPVYINDAGQMLVSAVVATQPIGSGGATPKQYLVSPSNAPVSPVIGSVLNADSHLPGTSRSTWIQILGQNLSNTTRSWASSDFAGNQLPTGLDGTSVTINGLAAYPSFVSPTQLTVLAPDDAATGPVQVQVTTTQGASAPFTVTKSDPMPALLTSQAVPTTVSTQGLASATHADGKPVCRSMDAGCNGYPAIPGETLSLFGTGFGATTLLAPAGKIVSAPTPLLSPVSVTIAGQPATVTFAGLVMSGVDQINIVIPASVPRNANADLVATVNGVSTPNYVFIPIEDSSN